MKKYLLSLLPGILFAITAPVIFYLANRDNRILIAWTEIFGSILLTLAVFGILYGLAWLLTRQPAAAGIVAAIFLFGIFYLWQIALALVLVVLICIGALRLLRKKIDLMLVNVLLVGLSVVVAGFYGWQLISFLLGQPSIHSQGLMEPVAASQAQISPSGERPDIYYIILDGYGRADMLKQVYGFDNSDFIQGLQDLGFVVTTGSRSNYPQTVLSLGSSLNMQYLDTMAEKMASSNVWWPAMDPLAHNQARQFLESRGYRTVFLASGFDYTDIRDGKAYLKPFPLMLNNFDSGYLRFTNLASLGNMGGLIPYPSYSTLRRILQGDFEELPQAAAQAGPKFVFAHITAPHPPFVFDAAGNPVNPRAPFTMVDKMREIMAAPEYKASYVAEMKYINGRTLETLKAILKASSTPPVIILQGDHGPGLYLGETAASSCLYERYSILNAYYLPGIESASVPEDITPVNSFRMVFNDYFSTHFPLLPNKNYFASFSHFYEFQDVSSDIQPVCHQDSQP